MILPKGNRFDNGDILVVEQEPCCRTVHLINKYNDRAEISGNLLNYESGVCTGQIRSVKDTVYLAFPYVLFVFYRQQPYWFFRDKPFSSLDDVLHSPFLPNTRKYGSICFSESAVPLRRPYINGFLDRFWQSQFNTDLRANCFLPMQKRCKEIKSLLEWQANSKIDPTFILNVVKRRGVNVGKFRDAFNLNASRVDLNGLEKSLVIKKHVKLAITRMKDGLETI